MISTKIVIMNFREKLSLMFFSKVQIMKDKPRKTSRKTYPFRIIKVASVKISKPDSVGVKLKNTDFGFLQKFSS